VWHKGQEPFEAVQICTRRWRGNAQAVLGNGACGHDPHLDDVLRGDEEVSPAFQEPDGSPSFGVHRMGTLESA